MIKYDPREQVFQAMFDLVSQAYKYKRTGRKLVLWHQVEASDRPSLFQHEMDEEITGGDDGRPPLCLLHANLFIYTWAKDVEVPATLLNPLIDSVFQALAPSPMTGKNNLGLPFVDHCWIKGKIFKDTGDIDGDGLAVIPVVVRMPQPLTYPS